MNTCPTCNANIVGAHECSFSLKNATGFLGPELRNVPPGQAYSWPREEAMQLISALNQGYKLTQPPKFDLKARGYVFAEVA